jgi:hypothetical protein
MESPATKATELVKVVEVIQAEELFKAAEFAKAEELAEAEELGEAEELAKLKSWIETLPYQLRSKVVQKWAFDIGMVKTYEETAKVRGLSIPNPSQQDLGADREYRRLGAGGLRCGVQIHHVGRL